MSTSSIISPARADAHPGLSSPELAHALEHVEREVWGDFHGLTTEAETAAGGLHSSTAASATLLAASGIDILFFNRVIGLGMEVPASEALLDEIIARYEAAGVPRFFIQVSPAAVPAALVAWLDKRGFVHHNNWTKLFRGVEDPLEGTTDLRIERVGAAHAEVFASMTAQAFGWPALVQPMLARLVGRPGWQYYMAFDGETPAAAAALYVRGSYGYLGPAVTLPAYRGRGAQSAFIALRIRDAAALGCRLLVSETAEDRPDHPVPSFRNLRRAGFQVAYLRPNYLLKLPQPAA